MPDTRSHRGAHPEDARLFAPPVRPLLREAAGDLAWLLERGYPAGAAGKLVGDRYRLTTRQRTAVARGTCSPAQAAARAARRVPPEALADRPLWIDGYNLLTTVEAALGGGVILAARDGTYRDMASMHGSYRKVAETRPALARIGGVLAALGAVEVLWLLDQPVSNSGRLKRIIEEEAAREGWPWQVQLVDDPDRLLVAAEPVVATADSAVLDRCGPWVSLARAVVRREVPSADVIDLGGAA